jgi:hypothetical protein
MATETAILKPEGKRTVANSVLEQLKKLDEQRTKLLDGAKAEAMKKAEEAIAELKELGFDYRLVHGAESSGGGKKRASTQKPAAERHCDICDANGHDARAHRSQNPKKKFTAKELAEKGLA